MTNGLFAAQLDFGSNIFNGNPRWLQIGARTNGDTNPYVLLAPLQPVTATPYAIFAPNAGTAQTAASAGSVSAANISGTLALARLPSNVLTNGAGGVTLSGTFSGNGAGVTNVSLANINSGGTIATVINWGNFVLSSSPGVGYRPLYVVAADVNGDGKPDLISANYVDLTLTVLTNNGGVFGFNATLNLGSFPSCVAAADVNGDGTPGSDQRQF